jgi:hypothetical protein
MLEKKGGQPRHFRGACSSDRARGISAKPAEGSAAAGSLFPQFRKYCCSAASEVTGQNLPPALQKRS